jgi:hypothetical protein
MVCETCIVDLDKLANVQVADENSLLYDPNQYRTLLLKALLEPYITNKWISIQQVAIKKPYR